MDKFSEGAKASLANCFVPELLVEYIKKNVRQGKEKMEPASFFMEGVCLLVDISGFTMMSERYCNEGKRGIDSLQLATNGYMGKLVEVIYSFGGDIMKFAGDALICVFSSNFTIDATSKGKKVRRESGNPSVSVEVILRAMHCAHVIRSVQTDSLSVHVAMSCGEMCFGILGGVENRWECLISGPCIRQLSDCLDDAPSKQAAITPQCAAILNQHLSCPADVHTIDGESVEHFRIESDSGYFEYQLVAMPSGNCRVVKAHRAEDTGFTRKTSDSQNVAVLTSSRQKAVINKLVRQFVPAPIADELENATGLSYFSEIREVTTMFMTWDSYDADGRHRDLLELQACFYQAQRILHSTGAYLRQFLVDDKGCVLIGCWGVPNMSYVDNTDRALSAAAQIRQELDRLGMETSVGITVGDVYCGTVGSERRMEYAAIGTVVNMAARLMSKAKGRLLIDDVAHGRLTKTSLDFLTAIDPMMVKGRATPLQAFAYIASYSTKMPAAVSDNGEISAGCRQVLTSLLQDMLREQANPYGSEKYQSPANSAGASATSAGASAKDALIGSRPSAGTRATSGGSPPRSHQEGMFSALSTTFTGANLDGSKTGGDKKGCGGGTESVSGRSEKTDRTAPNNSARPSRQSSALLSSTRSRNGTVRSSVSSIQFASNLTNLLWFGRAGSSLAANRMPLVLLNGKEGSGRTTAVMWLKAQAAELKLPTVGAKLTKKESQVDFHVWKRLFHQLMPRDMFQSTATQRLHATALLNKVYSATPHLAETVGFPALKQVLGVTCTYSDDHSGGHDSPTASPKKIHKGNWSQSVSGLISIKPKPKSIEMDVVPLQETLLKIFTYLLHQQPTLVVLENIEHADEESLKLLTELMSFVNLRSGFVLTALQVDSAARRTKIGPFNTSRTHEVDAFHHTPWSRHYCKLVQDHRLTTTVVLEKYTLQDIEKMLTTALGSCQSVPADLAQLVIEFSGGSSYWVREIIQSVKDNGVEQFMSAIGGNADESLDALSSAVAASAIGTGGAQQGGGFEVSFRVKRNSISTIASPKAATARFAGNRATSMKAPLSRAASSNNVDNHFSQMKLDKLVLCRFNSLSADVQRTLRTASVIGAAFSGGILYGVLSRHLKEQMSDSVDILLAHKWIFQDTEEETVYHFAHPHSHKIIYQLTPSSERNNLHQLIAEYIEEKYGDDKAQYAALCYHYQHCDAEKALDYCAQAVTVLLDTQIVFDYGDCLDLMFGCYPCCKTTGDTDRLIKLTRQVRSSLEDLRVGAPESPKSPTWMSGFFNIIRGFSTINRGTSYRVSPVPSSTSSSGKLSDTSTEDGETDLGVVGGADGEVDYEIRTKRIFLSQLNRLNDQLHQKLATLAATATAAAIYATAISRSDKSSAGVKAEDKAGDVGINNHIRGFSEDEEVGSASRE